MYGVTGTGAAGAAGASIFVAFTLVFLYSYLYLVEPLSVEEDVRVGLLATGLSLTVVFVTTAAGQAIGV